MLGEHAQHRPLGVPPGRNVAEFAALTQVARCSRDRDALLVEGDDARINVGGARHGWCIAQVARDLIHHAGDGALAGGLGHGRGLGDGQAEGGQYGRVPGPEVLGGERPPRRAG